MKKITVNASSTYEIIIGKDILSSVGEYAREALGAPSRICILSDDNVAPLYLKQVKASMSAAGFSAVEFIIPYGESSKSTKNLIELVEFMAENRLSRSDALLALGGGVVGDLGGFASSVYLRGIRFISVPTTLLAAVDSSVGGKTAVDLIAGKNLMGTFHQPSLVFCDCDTLKTLPSEIFSDGCAEVIKYGIINDRDFFDSLKEGIDSNIEEVIATCVTSKAKIVEADEFDRGQRQLLNLGHTVGHAIEACSDFSISHGSAVAIGTVIVTRSAAKMGLCPESDLNEIISLFKSFGLPTECPYTAEELVSIATADKKRAGDSISLVVPYSIGDTRLYKIPIDSLLSFIQKGI